MLNDPALWHRIQFAFTITYHYLFPQLTMGLAWFLVYWKWKALRTGDEKYNRAARFWARVFGLNFAVGVVTGFPMEFQFGTNWAGFSKYAGGVIGQTLAMEGMFAFFLESAFIGALIWGEKRLGPRLHFWAAVGVATGSWLSGVFILVTNSFMQHPVGYTVLEDGTLAFDDLRAYLLNPWVFVQFAHNQCAALVTGSFVVAAVGAFYTLRRQHAEQARLYLNAGTLVGLIASLLVAFPTGDQQAKFVGRYQPATLAAMEGRFHGGRLADLAVIGQPNVAEQRLENPIQLPGVLSFLAYGTFESYVRGLDEFPKDEWPDNIELLYYSFHIMITLGTLFIGLMGLACLLRWRGRLETARPMLWALMLAFPFPYIANSLGWMTAELGRQPWLVYGLFRTTHGASKVVSPGDAIFTLIGFCGLYFVLGVLFLYLVGREIMHGPGDHPE
ncbi:MAG: cytochrome ubiquinol oxidase subunit I [Candidatus Eremiobacteraeota bacterium]|nr:cytochrome ubiquinol oxidase subunit I [Candidatus Eremiobacteraeota bacterium]MCW5867872.1 cytochrome ubiquinol oxidase subunit I [Candidatus Eremiobacteraeota bacterium]